MSSVAFSYNHFNTADALAALAPSEPPLGPPTLSRISSVPLLHGSSALLPATTATPFSGLPLSSPSTTQIPVASVIAPTGLDSLIPLAKADNLRDVIAQYESGHLSQIANLYGTGQASGGGGRARAANPAVYASIKAPLFQRNAVVQVFINDFDGDHDRFFTFFSAPAPKKGKRKREDSDEHLRPFKKLAEKGIKRCTDAWEEERRKVEYMDDSEQFSPLKWNHRWGKMNKWEVWRELGGEQLFWESK